MPQLDFLSFHYFLNHFLLWFLLSYSVLSIFFLRPFFFNQKIQFNYNKGRALALLSLSILFSKKLI